MAKKKNPPSTAHAADTPDLSGCRPETRPGNKYKRPGILDLPRYDPDNPARVPTPPPEHREKVRASKQAASAAKIAAQAKREAAIQRAGQLYVKMAEVDNLADEARRNPPPPQRKKKVTPRPVSKPQEPVKDGSYLCVAGHMSTDLNFCRRLSSVQYTRYRGLFNHGCKH